MFNENQTILREITNNGKFLYKNTIIEPNGNNIQSILINLFNTIKNNNVRQDDVLLLDGNFKSIDNIDLFEQNNLNQDSKNFIVNYKSKINNIEKPNFNNFSFFKKSFTKELKNIINCDNNDNNLIMFEYNIKQQIKINFEGFYNYINDFINQDESEKFEKIINLDTMANILENKKEVINYLEKDLMFFLFEHYNKYKKLNHIKGISNYTKSINSNISKSLNYIIENYDVLNTKLTKKIKYFEEKQKDYYLLFDDIISLFPYGLNDFIDKSYSKDTNNIFTKIQTVKTKQNKKPQTDEEIPNTELSIYYKEKFEKEIEKLSTLNYEANELIKFNHKIIKYGLFNILFLINYNNSEEYLKVIDDFLINIDNYSKNFKNKDFNNSFVDELLKISNKVKESNLFNNYNIDKTIIINSLNSIFKEDKDILLTYYIDFVNFSKYLEYCNLNVYKQFKEVDFLTLREFNFISTELNNKTINYPIEVSFNFFKKSYKVETNETNEEIINNNNELNNELGKKIINFGKYKDKSLMEIYEKDKQYLDWLVNNSNNKSQLKHIIYFLKNKEQNLNNKQILIKKENTNITNGKYDIRYKNIIICESQDYLNKYKNVSNKIIEKKYPDTYSFYTNDDYIIDLSLLFELYNKDFNNFNIYQKILFELNFNFILNSYFNSFNNNIDLNNIDTSINIISLVSKEGTSSLTNILYNTINDICLNLTSINKNLYFNKQTFNFDKNDLRDYFKITNELNNKMGSSKISLMENSPFYILDDKIIDSYLIMCKYESSTKKYYVLEFLIKNNKIKVGYNIHNYINFNVINSNIEKYKIQNTFFVINKRNSFSNEINNLEKEFYKNINNKGLFLYQTSDSKIYDKYKNPNTYGFKYLKELKNQQQLEYNYKIDPLFSLNTFINLNKNDNTIINISKGNLYLINSLINVDSQTIDLFYKIIILSHIKFTSKATFTNDSCIIKNNNMRNLWKNSDTNNIVNINNKKYNLLLTTLSSIFIGLNNDK